MVHLGARIPDDSHIFGQELISILVAVRTTDAGDSIELDGLG